MLHSCYIYIKSHRILFNLHQITTETMNSQVKILTTNNLGYLIDDKGIQQTPPSNWSFLAAGDAGITRKVTSQNIYWKVIFKKGRRTMSKGIWAPKETIEWAIHEVNKTRSTEEYQKKRSYQQNRRAEKQNIYEIEFKDAVVSFLDFHIKYSPIAETLAIIVTKYAIPIGSGTVARTSMIPVEERAAKAVIAWMRHQTTHYDTMNIAKIKGERRKVRRNLAEESVKILNTYRKGEPIPIDCPLKYAITKTISV